jgi:hypothetical protein
MSKKVITAKFNSTCAETGRPIKKGEPMVYDYVTKKCYARGSNTQVEFVAGTKEPATDPAGRMLDDMIEQHHETWYNQEYR